MGIFLSQIVNTRIKEHSYLRDLLGRPQTLIVPIPLHSFKLRKRGFNQAETLARSLEGIGTIETHILKRILSNTPQAKIKKRSHRIGNVSGSFALTNSTACQKIENAKIILVDDVYTTGATLNECARLLKNAGAKEVWGVTLAHG